MLAKIAHSFAVAEYGHGTFEPFLPRNTLGQSPHIFHYVGGVATEPPRSSGNLHWIMRGQEHGLITVFLCLFAIMDALVYEIVVGRVR